MKDRNPGGLWETAKTVVYAVLIALFIRTVAFEPFNIPSGSMIPTLLVGDYLFVSKYSYGYSRFSLPLGLPLFSGRLFFHSPKRGDVVVFKLPSDNKTDYIKRLIGMPGDHLQMKGGRLYINDKIVERRRVADYIEHTEAGQIVHVPRYIETLPNGRTHPVIEQLGDSGPLDNTGVYVVPPGDYFFMGDNRDNSLDSRVPSHPGAGGVGYVPAENLVGRAEIIFFSTDGSAQLWELWNWLGAMRFDRFLQLIR